MVRNARSSLQFAAISGQSSRGILRISPTSRLRRPLHFLRTRAPVIPGARCAPPISLPSAIRTTPTRGKPRPAPRERYSARQHAAAFSVGVAPLRSYDGIHQHQARDAFRMQLLKDACNQSAERMADQDVGGAQFGLIRASRCRSRHGIASGCRAIPHRRSSPGLRDRNWRRGETRR